MQSISPVNATASATITVLGVATAATAIAAATVTSTVAVVALAVLATLSAALSTASIIAFFNPSSTTSEQYLENCKTAAAVTIPAFAQTVGMALFHAFLDGLTQRVTRAVRGGEDHTIGVVHHY